MCFCCKLPIIIKEDGSFDAVFVNNHFYHTDCFLRQSVPIEKCYYCGKSIISVSDKVTYYDKHFWHKDCIIKKSQQTKTKKWRQAVQVMDKNSDYAKEQEKVIRDCFQKVYDNIPKYKHDAEEQIHKWICESKLNDYIRSTYNAKVIPWTIMKRIYDGTYKNITSPIPAEHLLDMWKRKQKTLDKIYYVNKSKGRNFTSEQRIKYDIAVLVSKYDSYLKWKQEQKIIAVDNAKSEKDDFIVSKMLASQPQISEKSENNIEGLSDEIFS